MTGPVLEEDLVVNTELMLDVLRQITLHPETWRQSVWGMKTDRCGTAYCFGGWAVLLGGAEIYWRHGMEAGVKCDLDVSQFGERVERYAARPEIGLPERLTVWSYAERALGLTESQAQQLFASSNSLTKLRYLVREYTGLSLDEVLERTTQPHAATAEKEN